MGLPNICSFDNCGQPVYGRGICSRHYQRVYKNGTLELYSKKPSPLGTVKERLAHRTNRFNTKARDDLFAAYGYDCACCGESRREFLSLDHIGGGGGKARRETGITGGIRLYVVLRKQGYPSGYRILCHNCNQAVSHFDGCSHPRKDILDIMSIGG